jgi:hypothetical protein
MHLLNATIKSTLNGFNPGDLKFVVFYSWSFYNVRIVVMSYRKQK